MGKHFVSILATLALIAPVGAATAAPKSPKLAKCDGKNRRPANPYGTILPSVDPENGTSTPPAQPQGREWERRGVEVFPDQNPAAPKPAVPERNSDPQVPPISGLSPSSSTQSC